MLNGLAVLMFGKKCPEAKTNDDKKNSIDHDDDGDGEPDENDDNFNVEDDWILINKQEKAESSSSDVDVMSKSGGDFECSDFELMTMPSTRASSCSSVARIAEWNLMPPPCFDRSNSHCAAQDQRATTRGGGGDREGFDMEISIFENLLIEHPSSSVYCRLPLSANVAVAQQKTTVYEAAEMKENNVSAASAASPSLPIKTTAVLPRGKTTIQSHGARLTTLEQQQKFCCNNKLISISSTAEQQRCENVQKSRALSANRLRRNNLLVRHNCYTKRFANLQ